MHSCTVHGPTNFTFQQLFSLKIGPAILFTHLKIILLVFSVSVTISSIQTDPVDFTDLNKACPKDSYLLPRIDQLVDSTTGHRLLSFMDAFSRYNQIMMDEADQEKTSFITSQGLFCYKLMLFGLKNAGATYQRLVNHMFRPQIGWNVEVYVDDMLVKSQDKGKHLDDLQETFDTFRQYNMRLNPNKCAFGVSSRKFLGFIVSHRGIEANLDKIQAILNMKRPQNIEEVQSLTG